MSVVQINRHPTRRQLQQFGLIWMGFVALAGLIAFFKFQMPGLAFGLWLAAVVVPLIGWLIPPFMRLVFLGMSYLGWPIGFVVSHVVLAIVYYLVLTPIGLMTRLFGYDSMRKRFDRDAATYWAERPSSAVAAKRYFRQF
jgi:hypothetical protein